MKIHEPPMLFASDELAAQWAQGLDKNQDPYGRACYRYASEWATRMERGLVADGVELMSDVAVGKWIAANADKHSHEADDEGITGFMYGCSVSILAGCWKYGDQLRRWHNKETQLGTEGDAANESGGVLNPAILCFGEKK